MVDLNILFLDKKGKDCVGAPNTFHEFEQAVSKKANCVWAGEGWKNYHDEAIDSTVRRVMPNADWVIADRNKLIRAYTDRRYRVGVHISDLHGKFSHGVRRDPVGFLNLLNSLNYDAFFLKYAEICGMGVDPNIFKKFLPNMFHLPWSVDCEKHSLKEKTVDVAFLGAVGGVYPLRTKIYNNLEKVAKGYKVICSNPPRGDTFDRKYKLYPDYYVGERYVELLNSTRIMIFGSSKYRYPIQKYFESPASGCLVLADKPSTAEELGFVDGETYAEINPENWSEKLLYYLENELECRRISVAGHKNTLDKHTHEKRAEQWIKMLTA